MSHIKKAIQRAGHEAAAYMTADLRYRALEHGWDPEVVSNLHVQHSEGKFSTHVPAEHADKAFSHEYGTETTPPSAVIRKYSKSSAGDEAFFHSINKHLGGLF